MTYVPDPGDVEIAERAYCSVAILRPRPDEIATAVLTALAAAGRLLPTGGETEAEFGAWAIGGKPSHVCRHTTFCSAAREGHHTHRRDLIIWPDGTELRGPWVAVDEGSGTA